MSMPSSRSTSGRSGKDAMIENPVAYLTVKHAGDVKKRRKGLNMKEDSAEVREDASKCVKATCRTRTDDLRFTKPLLYQLS